MTTGTDWIATFGRAPSTDAARSDTAAAPSIVELRAQGARRADKVDVLAIIATLLAAHGFETCPLDHDPPSLDLILATDWRDLPIARAVFNKGEA